MKFTVGPHTPAVYWRRRAIVGAPLLLIVVLFSSCLASGSDGATNASGPNGAGAKAKAGVKTGAGAKVSAGNASDENPQNVQCTRAKPCIPLAASVPATPPAPVDKPVAPLPGLSPAAPSPAAATSGACSDGELRITATSEKAAYKLGAEPRFTLTITNISNRACTRDLGASRQELRVLADGKRLWSSDDCAPKKSVDVSRLKPGETRRFWLTWSGRSSTPGCPNDRKAAPPGTYQLVGRLDDATSAPAAFTLTR